MCRTGGRRCPSHTDPTLIAARNARRRNSYASHKHEGVGGMVETTHPAMNKLLAAMNQQPKTAAKPTIIDENSWKTFGFDDPHEIKPQSVSTKTFANMSKKDMAPLDKSEKAAIQVFTSNQYKWINGALYGKPDYLRSDEDYQWITPKPLHQMSKEDTLTVDRQCPTGLIELTDEMDSAMMKAPNVERVLYRGKSGASPRLKANPAKYVEENYGLGQEIVFDGYQSATVDSGTAAAYSGGNGIVFEMKTSSGLNATQLSHYSEEREILLPRATRWKVVGVHHGVKYTTYQDDGTTKFADATVVQMIEVNEQGEPLTERVLPAPLTKNQLKTYKRV